MKTIPRIGLALIAAAGAPAFVVIVPYAVRTLSPRDADSYLYAWLHIKNFGVMALLISFAHVIALGMPLLFMPRVRNAIGWWFSIFGGFVLGCIPIGFWTWPLRYPEPGAWSSEWNVGKAIETVNGFPTLAGWLAYVESVAVMGLFGAVGGLAFWLVWRSIRSNSPLKTTP